MNHLLGVGFILISAISYGAMPIFAKFAYLSGIQTHSLLFFRFFIAWIILLPIALLQKKRFPKGKDLCLLIALGGIGYSAQSYCYFTALTFIPTSLVAILLYIYPVIVAVLAVFFLNEALTKNKFIALCVAIPGAMLVIGPEAHGNIKGILFAVGAALVYSVYIVVGAQVMKRNDTFTASIVIIGSAAGFYLLYNLKTGFVIPTSLSTWMNILGIVLISTALAICTFFRGTKLIGAGNASLLSIFEPLTTMVLAWLFLGQYISGLQMAGALLILSATIIVALQSRSS
jgi:drug/metabolite transporter (DMT)-like permease